MLLPLLTLQPHHQLGGLERVGGGCMAQIPAPRHTHTRACPSSRACPGSRTRDQLGSQGSPESLQGAVWLWG